MLALKLNHVSTGGAQWCIWLSRCCSFSKLCPIFLQRQRKMHREKLVNDFTTSLNNFQAAQRQAAEKEKASVARARASSGLSSVSRGFYKASSVGLGTRECHHSSWTCIIKYYDHANEDWRGPFQYKDHLLFFSGKGIPILKIRLSTVMRPSSSLKWESLISVAYCKTTVSHC